jgi:hypothetical protein
MLRYFVAVAEEGADPATVSAARDDAPPLQAAVCAAIAE